MTRKTQFLWGLKFGLATWLLSSPVWAQPKGGPPPSTVVVEQVRVDTIPPASFLLGTVVPPRKSVVGSAVDGRVEDVLVREGDAVQGPTGSGDQRQPGQKLVQVLTKTIKIELSGAKAQLRLRKHELKQIEIAKEEIVQAETKLKVSEALRVFAKSKLERAETLFKQNRATTKQDLDEAVSAAEAAEQNYLGAISSHKLAEEGHPVKKLAAQAQVAIQQAEVNRIEDRLKKYTVTAPFDGYVTTLHTEIGAWIKQGDPVAEIIELDHVDVIVAVPESYVAYSRKGEKSTVKLDALPGKTFEGTIEYVVPQADLKSRTFPVKIRVKNEFDQDELPILKAGMLARAELPVGTPERGMVVRRDALVLDKEDKFVVVADFDVKFDVKKTATGPVRREKVKTGNAFDTWVIVLGNIKPGEFVVVEGNERLRDKQVINAVLLDSRGKSPQAAVR